MRLWLQFRQAYMQDRQIAEMAGLTGYRDRVVAIAKFPGLREAYRGGHPVIGENANSLMIVWPAREQGYKFRATHIRATQDGRLLVRADLVAGRGDQSQVVARGREAVVGAAELPVVRMALAQTAKVFNYVLSMVEEGYKK